MAENSNPQPQTPHGKVVQPLPGQTGRDPNPAAELIRQKISALYRDEPNAKKELAEAKAATGHRSKHQAFMVELSSSGKSLAEIQTAWHEYYLKLPDHEKHQVWQEFYIEHSRADQHVRQAKTASPQQPHHNAASAKPAAAKKPVQDLRTVADIKQHLGNKIQSRAQVKRRGHVKSILFGLSSGAAVMAVLLFGFFNERIIAPFITPSRTVSSTPIITDPNTTVIGRDPKIIIPKINVEIPVVYDEPSIAEDAVQLALERGVVHYATTSSPGEKGNGVIFGHSSNNILNKGKYKFAFVLLSRLENGDTFMLHKGGKRYVYKVFDKKIVPPTDLSVLNRTQKPSTFTLITCDPPGTSINRLVVVGEQVSPSPGANVASTAKPISREPAVLPSNSPSLWQRFTNWIAG